MTVTYISGNIIGTVMKHLLPSTIYLQAGVFVGVF